MNQAKGFAPKSQETLSPLEVLTNQLKDQKATVAEVKLVVDYLKLPSDKPFSDEAIAQVKQVFETAGKTPIRKYLIEQYKNEPQYQSQTQPMNGVQSQPQPNGTTPDEDLKTVIQGQQATTAQAYMPGLEGLMETAQLQAANNQMLQQALTLHYMTNPDQITHPQALETIQKSNQMFNQGLQQMGKLSVPLALGMTGIPQFRELPSVQAAMDQFTQAHPTQAHLLEASPATSQEMKALPPQVEVEVVE